MKKFIKNFTLFLLILFMILIFNNSSEVKNAVIFSFIIFKNNVFPNIFPFLILSNLLINYGFVDICSKIFSPFIKKIYKINGACSFIFIMSLLTGSPSNAKYTKDLYERGIINSKEATKILSFTHFANPLFIIGVISSFLNKNLAFKVLIAHYATNLILGLFLRNYTDEVSNNYVDDIERVSFGECLSNAISDAIEALLLIFGTITVFLILSKIINNTIYFTPFINTFISGIIEMTQGLKFTSLLNISDVGKSLLMVFFLSFGGISVHMQIISIISNTKIKYSPFFISRIFHAVIATILLRLII